MSGWRPRLPVRDAPVVALVAFATVVPAAVLASRAFASAELIDVWRRPGVPRAAWFSVWQGLVSTIATLAVAAVPTWIISRFDFGGRRVAHAVLTVPFVLPTVVVASAFMSFLPSRLDHSIVAVLLAHVFFNIAVVVRVVGPALAAIDERRFDAARTLGASPLRTLVHVAWPAVRRSVATAGALVFIMCATSYGVVRLLGPSGTDTVETEIFRRAVRLGDLDGAVALALIQTLAIVAVLAIGTIRRRRTDSPTMSVSRRPAGRARTLVASTVCLLVATPTVSLVVASLRSGDHWTASGWRALLSHSTRGIDVDIRQAVVTSLVYAAIAAIVATVIAVGSTGRGVANLVGTLPLAISSVVVGLGIIVTYDGSPFDFRGSWWLVPVVHASIATPFACRSVSARRAAIPRGLFDAAATLGSPPWRRFLSVEAPLLRPAISTAVALSAAISLGEFGATSLLSRSDEPTLTLVVARLLSKAGDIPYTAAMATATLLLMLTVSIVMALDRTVGS